MEDAEGTAEKVDPGKEERNASKDMLRSSLRKTSRSSLRLPKIHGGLKRQ